MDAWEILKDNSTLSTGDAWEHLNNQNSGTGSGTGTGEDYPVYIDALFVEVSVLEYDLQINTPDYDLELDDSETEVYIDTPAEYILEIEDGY